MSETLKSLTLSFNCLLLDIYREERRISEILLNYGFAQEYIDDLKGDKLTEFYKYIQFAIECRFLHYSGGKRLLEILYRRYGLFKHQQETLEEIGKSMGVSRERVRQLQNKAMKRLVGGVSADATGILILLSACHVLDIDPMTYIRDDNVPAYPFTDISENDMEHDEELNNEVFDQNAIHIKPVDLPKASFYVSGSFDYVTKRGKYRMVMACGDYKKYIEKVDIEGHSDVHMILLAIIEGLTMLRKSFDVTVYSNTLFGVSSLYYKNGTLKTEISPKSSNYELKEHIRQLLGDYGHALSNVADGDIREKIALMRTDYGL